MDARWRAEFELFSDLRHRGRYAVRVHVPAKVIEDLSLSWCDHLTSDFEHPDKAKPVGRFSENPSNILEQPQGDVKEIIDC